MFVSGDLSEISGSAFLWIKEKVVLLEALGLLAAIAVLAIAVALTVGIPLAMALNDNCASLKC